MEISDLYQEGLIGLIHAINTFDEKKDVTFYTYANACIKSTLISAMRNSFRMKNRILNNSFPLDKIVNDTNYNYYEILNDTNNDPDNLIFKEEETKEILEKVKSKLSKNEKNIFELKLSGLNNKEVANLLDKDKKYVENALFRISKKYKDMVYNSH